MSDNKGIALYDGTHRLTGRFGILRSCLCNRRHKDPVHLFPDQIPDMTMGQLGRKTNGIRRHRRQAFFEKLMTSLCGNLYTKAQLPPEGGPEGHGLPKAQHPGQTDGDLSVFSFFFFRKIILKKPFFPKLVEIGSLLLLFPAGLYRFPNLRFLWITQNLSLLAAVIGDPAVSV